MSRRLRSSIARISFAAYLVVLAALVFVPVDDDGATGIIRRTAAWLAVSLGVDYETTVFVLDLVANVALFVPFGMLATAAFERATPTIVVLAAALTSAVIEIVQLAIPSRVSSWTDVVANTAGAAVGLLIVRVVARAQQSSAYRRRERHPLDLDRSRTAAPSPAVRGR